MRKKIAIVNQRYGDEVNGGSEYYTKELAEHLSKYYEVEILTTTALDYDTWKPYYKPGVSFINGVMVRRFSVRKERNILWFKIVNKFLRTFHFLWPILEPLWLKAQGPYCLELIQFIRDSKNDYNAFIFVTYLYYTTAAGLPEVEEKSVLVPTAHDEYCIYFHMYKRIFSSPKAIVYLTEEEKMFTERLFSNNCIPSAVAGSGIEVEYAENCTASQGNYLVYVGRVDTSKNCDELFDYFIRLKKDVQSDLKLVVIGKPMMELPEYPDIIYKGFINEQEKDSWIAGAKALIMPSEHESLSLAVLEAMYLGVPVIVNGRCRVLVGHCERSRAGLYYYDYVMFSSAVWEIIENKEYAEQMKQNGRIYVRKNYTWDSTIEKYRRLIEEKLVNENP